MRVAPSVTIDELMRDFAVGTTAIGNLSAFYFYGYAGMQIAVGLLMDRFGPRRLMTVADRMSADQVTQGDSRRSGPFSLLPLRDWC